MSYLVTLMCAAKPRLEGPHGARLSRLSLEALRSLFWMRTYRPKPS
jgi:hypothetical protein